MYDVKDKRLFLSWSVRYTFQQLFEIIQIFPDCSIDSFLDLCGLPLGLRPDVLANHIFFSVFFHSCHDLTTSTAVSQLVSLLIESNYSCIISFLISSIFVTPTIPLKFSFNLGGSNFFLTNRIWSKIRNRMIISVSILFCSSAILPSFNFLLFYITLFSEWLHWLVSGFLVQHHS